MHCSAPGGRVCAQQLTATQYRPAPRRASDADAADDDDDDSDDVEASLQRGATNEEVGT